MRGEYNIVFRKTESKISLLRVYRWGFNIKNDLKETGFLDLYWFCRKGYDSVAGSGELGNDPLGPTEVGGTSRLTASY
jgi:hypothetical protein